jgi:hypothetical protein
MKYTTVIEASNRYMRSGVVARASIVLGFIVLFLAAIAVTARDAIERAYVQHVLAGELDGDVSLGALRHAGDRTILDGVTQLRRRR